VGFALPALGMKLLLASYYAMSRGGDVAGKKNQEIP